VEGEEWIRWFGVTGVQRIVSWLASVVLCQGFIGGAVSLARRGGLGLVNSQNGLGYGWHYFGRLAGFMQWIAWGNNGTWECGVG